jgi:hypothetical protein
VPLNTIYLLRDVATMDGQNIENVYFFERVLGDGPATSLALDFVGEWLPSILALQSNAMVHLGISVLNLGDLGDFANLPLVTNGTYGTDDPLPSFNAVGYTFKLNTRAVRPGGKRIAGIPEVVTTKNEITDAEYITRIEALRLKFSADLEGADDTWRPVVIKRTKQAIAGTVPTQYRYGLPTSADPLVVGNVAAVLSSTKITSQVSRK